MITLVIIGIVFALLSDILVPGQQSWLVDVFLGLLGALGVGMFFGPWFGAVGAFFFLAVRKLNYARSIRWIDPKPYRTGLPDDPKAVQAGMDAYHDLFKE